MGVSLKFQCVVRVKSVAFLLFFTMQLYYTQMHIHTHALASWGHDMFGWISWNLSRTFPGRISPQFPKTHKHTHAKFWAKMWHFCVWFTGVLWSTYENVPELNRNDNICSQYLPTRAFWPLFVFKTFTCLIHLRLKSAVGFCLFVVN